MKTFTKIIRFQFDIHHSKIYSVDFTMPEKIRLSDIVQNPSSLPSKVLFNLEKYYDEYLHLKILIPGNHKGIKSAIEILNEIGITESTQIQLSLDLYLSYVNYPKDRIPPEISKIIYHGKYSILDYTKYIIECSEKDFKWYSSNPYFNERAFNINYIRLYAPIERKNELLNRLEKNICDSIKDYDSAFKFPNGTSIVFSDTEPAWNKYYKYSKPKTIYITSPEQDKHEAYELSGGGKYVYNGSTLNFLIKKKYCVLEVGEKKYYIPLYTENYQHLYIDTPELCLVKETMI